MGPFGVAQHEKGLTLLWPMESRSLEVCRAEGERGKRLRRSAVQKFSPSRESSKSEKSCFLPFAHCVFG